MQHKLKLLGLVILLGIFTLILYIILHELGHCIVAVACGAKITEFSILTAHMTYIGGNFTDLEAMWLHANGILFPLIISYVYMIFYQKECANSLYRILSYFVGILPVFSLFAWVFIPILILNGNTLSGDDCAKFLDIFSLKYSPVLVIVSAVVLIVLGLILMIRKNIIKNFVDVMKVKH